jgi:hypothetical protein
MATSPPEQKVIDYMAEAVSPALIMALVGSLVYFLVEVLYVGEYSWQLLWGLSFFVLAAVLIARISIQQGTGKATVYAVCLAIPVWLTLQFYVEYPEDSPLAGAKAFVNMGLIALIWWCAHRLTWDCTFLDEKADAGSEGLLQASGLEQAAGTDDEEETAAPEEQSGTWWQRYQRYHERQRKRHTPGTWVVYFSLAALPLFGLGQSLIPAEEVARRRYVFWLMAIYVASGLGLLLTTTYLGLRRYLRQRQMRMPARMTGAWLGMGAALIVGLLAVGALLPRPQAEYSLVTLAGAGSTKRQASRWAMNRGAPGQGEGRPSSQAPRDEPKDDRDRGGQGQKGEGPGQKSDQGDPRSGGNKQGSGSGDRQGGQGGTQQGKGSGDQQGKQSGDRGSGQDKTEKSSGDTKSPTTGQGQRNNAATQRPQGRGQSGQQSSGSGSQSSPQSNSSPPQGSSSLWGSLGGVLGALAAVLRWVVFAVVVVVVLVLVLRGALRFLANFTTWAKDLLETLRSWWQALFGWWPQGGGADTPADAKPPAAPPVPFSAFRNPFHDGRADRLNMPQLIRYSFEALEAWARERGMGRRADETVLEFAGRLGGEVPALEADARRLASLYAHVLYGRGALPRNVRAILEQFWQRLETAAEQPLSA